MSNKWLCDKCNGWSTVDKTRCSFCSNPRPGAEQPNKALAKITQDLHNTIDKLNSTQKQKMWRWLEDNVL